MKDLDVEHRNLEDAYLLAEHDCIDAAIAVIDETFDNFLQFRAWYLTESNPEYALFDPFFVEWVAKIMVFMYIGKGSNETQKMVNATYREITGDHM